MALNYKHLPRPSLDGGEVSAGAGSGWVHIRAGGTKILVTTDANPSMPCEKNLSAGGTKYVRK